MHIDLDFPEETLVASNEALNMESVVSQVSKKLHCSYVLNISQTVDEDTWHVNPPKKLHLRITARPRESQQSTPLEQADNTDTDVMEVQVDDPLEARTSRIDVLDLFQSNRALSRRLPSAENMADIRRILESNPRTSKTVNDIGTDGPNESACGDQEEWTNRRGGDKRARGNSKLSSI